MYVKKSKCGYTHSSHQCWEGKQEDLWGLLASQPSIIRESQASESSRLKTQCRFLLRNSTRVSSGFHIQKHTYTYMLMCTHTYVIYFVLTPRKQFCQGYNSIMIAISLCNLQSTVLLFSWLLLKTIIMTELKQPFLYGRSISLAALGYPCPYAQPASLICFHKNLLVVC